MKDKVNEVYVLYSLNYNQCASENGGGEIIGVYNDEKKAKDKMRKYIEDSIDNYNGVLSDDIDSVEQCLEDGYALLFYGKQENWDYHYEYYINKIEVK